MTRLTAPRIPVGGSEMDASDALITKVLLHYFPHWDPPENRREWNMCHCPDHAEERPSCSVNYELGVIKCHACDFKGNSISIIQRKEGMRYAEAVRHAEKLFGGGYQEIQKRTSRKPRRRVFGESGTYQPGDSGRSRQVLPRVRGRSTPWSRNV